MLTAYAFIVLDPVSVKIRENGCRNYFMTNLSERYAAVSRLELAAPGLKSSYRSSVNVSWTFFFPTNEMMSHPFPCVFCLDYPKNTLMRFRHFLPLQMHPYLISIKT